MAELYNEAQFNQFAPLGDLGPLRKAPIILVTPGLAAASDLVCTVVERARMARGLDPETGKQLFGINMASESAFDQPVVPSGSDVTPLDLSRDFGNATADWLAGASDVQTILGVPVNLRIAKAQYSLTPVPVNPSEQSLGLGALWDRRAELSRAYRELERGQSEKETGEREGSGPGETKEAPEAVPGERSDAGRGKGGWSKAEERRPAQPKVWPTVKFPPGFVHAKVGRDGRPVPAMSFGTQMTVKGGKHKGERLFSGFAMVPPGTKLDGQDIGGYTIQHMLKLSDLEAVEKGRGVTLQFNPNKPLRLWKGQGEARERLDVENVHGLARAIRAQRDRMEEGARDDAGRARDAAREETAKAKGGEGKSHGPARRTRFVGVTLPPNCTRIVRDSDGNPMPATKGGVELTVTGGRYAGEALYMMEGRMPAGATIKGLDVSGMMFSFTARESMLGRAASRSGFFMSLPDKVPIVLSPPEDESRRPKGERRGEVTVSGPFELKGSIDNAVGRATGRSGPVRVSHTKPTRGPEAGEKPKATGPVRLSRAAEGARAASETEARARANPPQPARGA